MIRGDSRIYDISIQFENTEAYFNLLEAGGTIPLDKALTALDDLYGNIERVLEGKE